jgi:uncharacterized damage-inducible protein DinB
MTTRQAIIETIQQANDQTQQTFAVMSEAQAQMRVGDGGWTAKEVLAHMAGRQPTYQRLIDRAGSNQQAFSGRVDPDAWNESLVIVRREQPLQDILREFLTVHEEVIAQVKAMSEERLAQPIQLPQGEMTLGELLKLAAGNHTLNHLKEVRLAVDKNAPES